MKTLTVGEVGLAARAGVVNKRRERVFYTGMAAAIAVTVFAGFARTYFLRPYFEPRPLMPLLHLHGVVFTSWVLLFLAQTALVAARRTDIHRRLGVLGAVLAALMVSVGCVTAVIRAKMSDVGPGGGSSLAFLTVPLGDLLIFAILVGAGIYLRRRAAAHKRLLLLSMISILPAAVARLPFDFIQQSGPLVFFYVTDLFIVPCLLYDLFTRGRPHRANVLGGLLIVISHPLRPIIGSTHAWLAFASWLTQWV